MKTVAIISAIAIVAMLTATASAKVWRVDNKATHSADFTELQAAHDGASDGDTLYVAGSGVTYGGGLTLTKTLFIFGPGYFLDENPETQARLVSANSGQVIFNEGSEGSLLTGVSIFSTVSIAADNVIFKRNYLSGGGTGYAISINGNNVIIAQNYLVQTSTGPTITLSGQNIIVSNNYITGNYAIGPSNIDETASYIIGNNVISGNVNIINAEFRNNILLVDPRWGGAGFQSTNTTIHNNIGDADQFGTENGNQENVDMTTVFVGTEGHSTDGQWQLAPGSPAMGAGLDGADCGMFGGSDPYVLSGLPPIPAIYFFDAPITGSTDSGLQVNVKVKSHK